jgi:hypothetical protein
MVLHASPASGVAPLTVRFSLFGQALGARVELDADGDGVADFSGDRLRSHPVTFARPGLYTPGVTVIDGQGTRVTLTAVVVVDDRITFDAQLQAKWSGLRDALRRADIEGALRFVATGTKDAFRADFTILAAFLPALGGALEDIRLVAVRGNLAEYELVTTEFGQTLSYYVEFVRDDDGIWRIAFF